MPAASRRFRRADRVLRSGEYREIARRGRRSSSRAFVLLWCGDRTAARARLGITVSRRVGNAVVRNRIKRRVREWFRCGGRQELSPGALVVIARPGAGSLASSELGEFLTRQLAEVA